MKEFKEDIPTYVEDYDDQDFVTESITEGIPSYIEDFDAEDFGLVEDVEEDEEESDSKEILAEDLDTSFPVTPMSESEVRSAAKKIVKGAKVRFGYVKPLKLDSKYDQGKFVKSTGTQFPVVKAIKVTEARACTGVKNANTSFAQKLHATQSYQDKLNARIAAGKGGFGTNIHDSEAGLENILITTVNGLKCILAYPMSNVRPKNTYYISVAGEDWRGCTKEEIAKYMSPKEAEKFLKGNNYKAQYQAKVMSELGTSVSMPTEFTVIDNLTGEKIKLDPTPLNITYYDPTNRFKCVYALDKEQALQPVLASEVDQVADEEPLNQDFPEVSD